MKKSLIIKITLIIFSVIAFAGAANAAIEVHLISPSNGATGVEQPVILVFDVGDYVMEYEIIVDDNSDFSSPEIDRYTEDYFIGSKIDSVSGLAEGIEYYWYVRANTMMMGWMRSYETWHFTTAGCHADSPVLAYPENGTVNAIQPVYLDWLDVEGAVEYQLQVDDDNDFSSPVYDFTMPGCGTCVFDLIDGTTYYWRVKAVKEDCASDWCECWSFVTQSSLAVCHNESLVLPKEFKLYQNFPNPFNAATTIKFALPERQLVSVEVFNVLGEKVENILSRELPAGTWTLTWDASGFPSGIYYYRLQAGDFVETRKMAFMK